MTAPSDLANIGTLLSGPKPGGSAKTWSKRLEALRSMSSRCRPTARGLTSATPSSTGVVKGFCWTYFGCAWAVDSVVMSVVERVVRSVVARIVVAAALGRLGVFVVFGCCCCSTADGCIGGICVLSQDDSICTLSLAFWSEAGFASVGRSASAFPAAVHRSAVSLIVDRLRCGRWNG